MRVTRLYLLGRRFRHIILKEFDSVSQGLKPQAFGELNNGMLRQIYRIAMRSGAKS